MKFQDLVAIVLDEPVFDTGLLLAGLVNPTHVQRQLSRWVRAGRVVQLQRAGAMTALAFQGGTCMRFLFSLPRYSEDLDFAFEGDRSLYDLGRYLRKCYSAGAGCAAPSWRLGWPARTPPPFCSWRASCGSFWSGRCLAAPHQLA